MAHLVTLGIPMVSPELTLEPGGRFAALLEDRLGQPAEVRVFNYSELTDALAEGRVDFAWLPPVEAHLLFEHAGVVRLLQAIRGGHSHYHSVLFVREDSPLQGVVDLAGRDIAWVHRRSASGFLVMAGHLRGLGVEVPIPPRYLGSHGAVVQAVVNGDADAGATYGTLVDGEVSEASWQQLDIETPMRIIAHVGPVSTDALCAWPGTSKAARAAFVAAVHALSQDEAGAAAMTRLFGTARFAPAEDDAYDAMALAFDRLR